MTNKLQKTRLGVWSDAGLCCTTKLMSALLLGLVTLPVMQAQTFTTLYNFTGGQDGAGPDAGVIQDPAGDLYGTTYQGGDLNRNALTLYGGGVVFRMDTTGKETVLYTFCSQPNCVDGADSGTPVTRDKAGNIYGTTQDGGSGGEGTVFKVDTAGNETVLHSFTGGSDGFNPGQGVIMDKAGNLYGTTQFGGAYGCQYGPYGCGTIFRVDSAGDFTILHAFTGTSSDGANPGSGHLTMDKLTNLYGVTPNGGSTECYSGHGCGVLYKLSKKGTFTVLHRFARSTTDGCYPYGSVLRDKTGNFYGTTQYCGSTGNGTIWKVSKKGKETILHNFAGGTSDGCSPFAGVSRDSKGNLYGVTAGCGANGYGALYELSAKGRLTLLHSFDGTVGYPPSGEVLRTVEGTLYGTTSLGSTGNNCTHGYGCGTVWSYVP
jgi:uncharacterized repeat protein (TIGR03803 family)